MAPWAAMAETRRPASRVQHRPTCALRRIALAGLLVFVTTLAVSHVIHPGLSPRSHRISEYATASGGVIITIGFASWCVAMLACALAMRSDRSQRTPRALALLLLLASAGMALVTVFHTQTSAGKAPPGTHVTWTGRAHDLGSSMSFIGLVAAALVGAISSSRLRRTMVLMPLIVAALAVAGLGALDVDAPGIRQRLLVAAAVCWLAAAVRITAEP